MTTTLALKNSKEFTFEALVERVRETLAQGRARAQKAVDIEKGRTYWQIGRHIHLYLLRGKDRAQYGGHLFDELAAEINLSPSVVHDMVSVYRAFPILRAPEELTWTNLQQLSRIKDSKTRQALAKKAIQQDWASRELENAVREVQKALPAPRKKNAAAAKKQKLIPKKGKFFTYRIVRPQNLHVGPGGLSLDLGFRVRHEIDFKGIRNPKLGEIIQVERIQKNAAGDRYKILRSRDFKASDLYTYKAKAQTFYDADTFWVDIDLGFHVWNEQKLRLRGIDAAELSEETGKTAAAYVQKVLSAVAFIVITIAGRDKFGRPLADIFYLPGTDDRDKVLREGKFLNQELLDLGFAKDEL